MGTCGGRAREREGWQAGGPVDLPCVFYSGGSRKPLKFF